MNNIPALIDLTRLDQDATDDEIKELTRKGIQQGVAALCVFPEHLNFIPRDASITRATVVNFPTGSACHDHVLRTIDHIATHDCVHEIDYVFPYQSYLNGDRAYALSCSSEAFQRCQQYGLLFKVILETGALPSSEMIYQLSTEVINKGCDFLKTSTGTVKTGATLSAATAMLSAMIDSKKPCGIKLSGGIKTIEHAEDFIQLAEKMMGKPVNKSWFRLGASGLLDLFIA